MSKIAYMNEKGNLSIIVTAPDFKDKLEDLAKELVPENTEYTILEDKQIPKSRNYRNGWEIIGNSNEVTINLDKAKTQHMDNIVAKATQRVPKDAFGQPDFSIVKKEFEALDIAGAKDLTELYNLWPKSIDKRSKKREYVIFEE